MYINNNTYTETHKCQTCENVGICRWCDDMKEARDYVDNEPNTKSLSPVRITVTCNSFKKKTDKQDGWFNKTGQRNY